MDGSEFTRRYVKDTLADKANQKYLQEAERQGHPIVVDINAKNSPLSKHLKGLLHQANQLHAAEERFLEDGLSCMRRFNFSDDRFAAEFKRMTGQLEEVYQTFGYSSADSATSLAVIEERLIDRFRKPNSVVEEAHLHLVSPSKDSRALA